jgi:hypothetical protein
MIIAQIIIWNKTELHFLPQQATRRVQDEFQKRMNKKKLNIRE